MLTSSQSPSPSLRSLNLIPPYPSQASPYTGTPSPSRSPSPRRSPSPSLRSTPANSFLHLLSPLQRLVLVAASSPMVEQDQSQEPNAPISTSVIELSFFPVLCVVLCNQR
ncbi:hypothetical protein MRB53_026534 [Persea americana]|uniref:Uncharacterized protein n=1 Tax=Persea americana TaxID=3435 RepID=A0ACC2LJ41_PERAE|nr:hypothetical protein MRB53_026534 [Persea americana]